jgi:hypothetical protein
MVDAFKVNEVDHSFVNYLDLMFCISLIILHL